MNATRAGIPSHAPLGRSSHVVSWAISATSAQASEAEAFCRAQRLRFAKWLSVDETKARPEDRVLIDRVMMTIDGDGTAYERALRHSGVNQLFARGVLFFARPA